MRLNVFARPWARRTVSSVQRIGLSRDGIVLPSIARLGGKVFKPPLKTEDLKW